MAVCCRMCDVDAHDAPIRHPDCLVATGQPFLVCVALATGDLLGATDARPPAPRSSPLSPDK